MNKTQHIFQYSIKNLQIENMRRTIQTSKSKRLFYHENQKPEEQPDNGITRPPTSKTYMRYARSDQKFRNKYDNYNSNCILSSMQSKVNLQSQTYSQFQLPKYTKDNPHFSPFRLLMNQIQLAIKNKGIQIQQVDSLCKDICIKIYKLLDNLQKTKIQLQKCQIQNSSLKELKKQAQNQSQKPDNSFHERVAASSSQYYSKKKAAKNPVQMQLFLENYKLGQLHENFLSKLGNGGNITSFSKTTDLKSQMENQRQLQDFDAEICRSRHRISYLQMKLEHQQRKSGQLTQENEKFQQQLQQLQKNYALSIQNNRKTVEKMCQWRQRAMMQYEESQLQFSRQNFLLFSIKKLRESNKNLTQKLLNQNADDFKSTSVSNNANFTYENDFFKNIRTMYFQNKEKEFRLNMGKKQVNSFGYTDIETNSFEQQYQSYRKTEEVDLPSFSYYRPSFYGFIQESCDTEVALCRVKGNNSVSRIFIQMLRAIMQSKFNEMILTENVEKFTRFPQFVFSWFQKFYFNAEKSSVQALEPFMQKPVSQQQFYKDLMNVKLDQSWEIITFREFLLEQLCLQELYFYLMCQNILFKKAGITRQILYLGQFCIMVEYNAAKWVVDLVLSDFESWNINFLANKLKEKIVIKKNIQFIEVGFFLRCLVQYYKIQRINRFKYLQKLCKQFKSCEKGLRYSSFISVINRFTQLSFDQKLKIYRQCYCVGKGKVTSQIIFTVCNELLIFLKHLKLKSFFKLPVQVHKPNKLTLPTNSQPQKKNIVCVQPPHPHLYQVFIETTKLLRDQENFIKRAESFGVS